MKVSVIIPCYNDGEFLKDAVSSVEGLISKSVEILIVNDGSTDPATLKLLESYQRNGIRVLSHENHGLAYTRNRGVREAKGEYILPLDADNIIKHRYIEKGIELLDSGRYDIVYSNPFFIGEDLPERKFQPHPFVGQDLFWGNYIDACAIYKKTVWESIGGYDEKMPYQGYEDWEFWLSSYLSGFRFKYINEKLYGYRIRSGSMIEELSNENKYEKCRDYMIQKHSLGIVGSLRGIYQTYQKHQKKPIRASLKYLVKPVTNLFKREK